MKPIVLWTVFWLVVKHASAIAVRIQTDKEVARTHENFVAVAIDSGTIRRKWGHFEPKSVKVQTLAQGLSPCFLRVGGTDADSLIFDPDKQKSRSDYDYKVNVHSKRDIDKDNDWMSKEDPTNFTMTTTFYDELCSFTETVGWNLIFDLNVLLRLNGHWDPANAVQLMKYTVQKGYRLAGWELGNEPNFLAKVVGPGQLASDFQSLRDILSSFPAFSDSVVLGPSTTQESASYYYQQFLADGGGKAVTAATFHFYYMNGRTATVNKFTDPGVLDIAGRNIIKAVNITRRTAPGVKVWIGETSSAYYSGAPNISDRYVAGFLWLNTLGEAARNGIDVVVRQTFYGGNYSLIDFFTLDPHPDYWVTLLYKRLVGPRVLRVTSPEQHGTVRVFAHCVAEKSGYPRGSVVIYILNLGKQSQNLTFPDFPGDTDLHLYLLEPHKNNLLSRGVLLNGRSLKMVSDQKLPPLLPWLQRGSVSMPAQTFGFVVIRHRQEKFADHSLTPSLPWPDVMIPYANSLDPEETATKSASLQDPNCLTL